MHLHTRNANTAFHELVSLFNNDDYAVNGEFEGGIIKQSSRNGNVLMIDEPVIVTYERPQERVLFNAARDANPFFHVYEALWMLAGWNDVAPLAYYASKMKDFSDDGETFNGAYGYRWRHAYSRPQGTVSSWSNDEQREVHWHHQDAREVDQLEELVNHLKSGPTSRRAVLTMWNVHDDLLKVDSSKDVCCNLNVMFAIHGDSKQLDMTVTNRSNDLIWGMLGANYVHFTFLQEYMAARLGVKVGRYHHFSNNLHVYDWNWKPEEWLAGARLQDYGYHRGAGATPDKLFPLVKDPEVFERELPEFVEFHGNAEKREAEGPTGYDEPFLNEVANPMLNAFHMHKLKDYDTAMMFARQIAADDWRFVAIQWLQKRLKNKEKTNVSE